MFRLNSLRSLTLIVCFGFLCVALVSPRAEESGDVHAPTSRVPQAFPEALVAYLPEAEALTHQGYCNALFGDLPIDPEHVQTIRFREVKSLDDPEAKDLRDQKPGTVVHAWIREDVRDMVFVTPKVRTLSPRRVAALLAHEVFLHLLMGIKDKGGVRVLCPKGQQGDDSSDCITDQIAAGCPQLRNKSPATVLAEAYRPQPSRLDQKQMPQSAFA